MSSTILVPLLPLLAALIVAVGPRSSVDRRAMIGVCPLVAALLGAIATLVSVASHGPISLRWYEPGPAIPFALPIGLYVDRLSAVMMVLITAIGILIYTYSMRYMQQERGYTRFLALMLLTIVVLLCMVSSANLVMLLVFWQLLTPLLSLLAHRHEHQATLDGAFKTFTLLRTADMAFLAGIVLAFALYGTVEFQELAARAASRAIALPLWPGGGLEISGATAVTLLIFIGAMGKSAQFPLHVWLPSSLYAPTPVHALLHAGIINAGGFLLNRLAPLYGLSSPTLHMVFVVGMLTAVLGACMMLTQNDIKKTLGFSTIGQMGYMIMECGLGAFALAVFHLIAHGLFKATVFLNCGNVIHKARQEPVFPHIPHAVEEPGLSRLTWSTGFVTTLLLPLVILLVTHGVLRIPLLESQGTAIFLFFTWVTSSQAILTLTRLRAVASWKVSAAMLLTLLFVVFTYLFAAEAFTSFLYPDPRDVAFYFQAAALPGWLFDGLIVGTVLLTILGWVYLYAQAHGRTVQVPAWVDELRVRLYVLLMNRFYVDALYARFGRGVMRVADYVDKGSFGRLS
ncbi:MAG: proton-conducting transporter membrane subunit [Nitrospirota bacterium]